MCLDEGSVYEGRYGVRLAESFESSIRHGLERAEMRDANWGQAWRAHMCHAVRPEGVAPTGCPSIPR